MNTTHRVSRWLLPLGAALLTACAAHPPQSPSAATPPVPHASPPAVWQAALPPAAGSQPLSGGWGFFDAPDLAALVDAAQQASPTLASAQARVERARAARVAAGAAAWPQVNAVGSASSGRNVPAAPTATSLSLGVQAAWELDLFGAVAAGRNAAQARQVAAEVALQGARTSVAAEVASSLLALRACEAQTRQTRLDAVSREQTARLTEQSANAGFTAPADAALARAGAAQARSQLLSLQAQCDTLVKSLVELTDLPEPALRQRLAAGTAQLPRPAALALDGLPAELLSRRPDLAEAAQAVIAAAADRNQSRAREGLQVSLSGNLAAASLRTAGVSTNGSTWSLGPLVVTFPLFDGGTRAASTAAAQAGYDEAVALYRAQFRRAVREVETALLALDSTAQRERDAEAAARDFEASLRATDARQKGGLASLFDLETARRNAVQAQVALIDLQRERAAAWIALYRALGGGWQPGPASTAAAQNPTATARAPL
ncbi:efflux transporter outer membrane subunit [Pseudorhodoferax sp.]|uniref:efflux transporter outer membrane subunit n=1 Tax=Pseudorhodoferax sp. TaxID=1993553 RepID=UPI002DD63243|nr:efflux transporter outer membrane subunit [Pseudorhodoferax sp.]